MSVQWSRANNPAEAVYSMILVPLFCLWNNHKQITIFSSSSLQIFFINSFFQIQITELIDHEYFELYDTAYLWLIR